MRWDRTIAPSFFKVLLREIFGQNWFCQTSLWSPDAGSSAVSNTGLNMPRHLSYPQLFPANCKYFPIGETLSSTLHFL
jgi:hypothetical protein